MEGKVLPRGEIGRPNATVFLVSDDLPSARIWAYSLKQSGMDVCTAGFSEKTLQVWMDEFPDLIVLDDHLARIDVLAFCRQMRADAAIPMLLLTSRSEEIYILEVYQTGIDDCIPNPVSPRIFLAKVKAWLRRAQVVPNATLGEIQVGDFHLNPDRRQVTTPCGPLINLTNLETRLLYLLMNHPGWILESPYLVERVWGHFGNGDSVLLKNLVYRLRRKIEPDPSQPRYLITESTLGYRFRVTNEDNDLRQPPQDTPGKAGGSTAKSSNRGELPGRTGHAVSSQRDDRNRSRNTGQLHSDFPLKKN